jgi:hypothetical protein
MTRGLIRVLAVGALLLLGACARGPIFSSVAIPPVAANTARIYFYREYAPYDSLSRPWIRLNGAPTLLSEPGGVSYRDVPPGSYEISVDSMGDYWNQFKRVDLRPGDAIYVRIDSDRYWKMGLDYYYDTFIVSLIGPVQARAEMSNLRYVPNGTS